MYALTELSAKPISRVLHWPEGFPAGYIYKSPTGNMHQLQISVE